MAMENKKIFSKLSFLKKKFSIIFIIILSLLLISIDFIIKIKRNNYFLDKIYIYSNIPLDEFYNSYETNNSTNKVLSYVKTDFGNWLFSKYEKVNIFFLAQINTSSEVFKEPIKIIEIDYNISRYKVYISDQILKKNISNNKLINRINSNYYSSRKIILVISNSKNDTNDEVRNIISAHNILYRNSYLGKCLENKAIFEKIIKIKEDYCNPIIYHETHSGDSLKRFNIYNLIFFYLLLFSGLCISFFYKKIK